MEQEIVPILRAKLENNTKIFIELKQIEEMIGKKIEYAELVQIINNFIRDGILKVVRKREDGKSSITLTQEQECTLENIVHLVSYQRSRR